MEELSTPEMLSLRGGADFNIAAVISAGNVAIAVPVAIDVGVAIGGSEVIQNSFASAEAIAGNISASIAQRA